LALSPGPAGNINSQASTNALLARYTALLPPGPGREVTIRACSTCHALDVVANQHLSSAEWTNVVQAMSARGMIATPEELTRVQSYLANVFPRASGQTNK
jgi:hypothetical protein